MLLIGSRALEVYYPEYTKDRNIIDWDFICDKNEFKDLVKKVSAQGNRLAELSFEKGTNKGHAKFINKVTGKLEVIEASFVDVEGGLQESDKDILENCSVFHSSLRPIMGCKVSYKICSFIGLYLLKLSHRYKKNSVHFEKTMQDLKFFESKDMKRSDIYDFGYEDILAKREALTYNYSHPKLNTSKKEFFTDSVPYQYDHDTIHEAVKHLDRPAYTYYMQDGEQVQCSKKKFFEVEDIVRLYGVLEESYVLALERAIIPHGTDPQRAFNIALEKVCTSITSGWFREFAYDNYYKVKSMYHPSFVNKFQEALERGTIKPYNKK